MNGKTGFVNGKDVQFAKRQPHVPPWLAHLAAAVGLGLLLAYLGPFRSGTAFAPAVRYPFWLGLASFGYGCALVSLRLGRSAPSLVRLGTPALLLVAALVSSVPQTLATAWALSYLQEGRTFAPLQLPPLFAAVFAVQAGITIAAWAVANRQRSAEAPPATPKRVPAFFQRVPARLGRDLIALEAEDHYLRVHTALGSELLLGRLSDAVAQLDGHDGLQVHRSWWVAASAVKGTFVSGGRRWLRLANDLDVPVSRARNRDVLAKDWPKISGKDA